MNMKKGMVPQAGDYLVPGRGDGVLQYHLYRPRQEGQELVGGSIHPSLLGITWSELVPDPDVFEWVGHTTLWVGVWGELREVLVPLGLWVEPEPSGGDRYKIVATA